MQNYIFVLRLQQNKIFIYFSEMKIEKQIMSECEIYYDYVKKYKPLSIIETIPFIDHFDIDKTVKHYMYYNGYDNVRGGSYIEEVLPEYLEKTLNHEFKIVDTGSIECKDLLKEILEKYENKDYKNIEEIFKEIDGINQEFTKYTFEKEKMERTKFFLVDGIKKNMKKFIPEDMDWLYEICLLNSESNIRQINHKKIGDILDSNYVTKYKTILLYLKQLYVIFLNNDLFSKFGIRPFRIEDAESNCSNPFISAPEGGILNENWCKKSVYLKNPEFLFDGFIYNTLSKDNSSLSNICKTFSLMGNIVYNMIIEQEYDVMSYNVGYEWKTSRILYILEKKREKFGKPKLIFDEPFI